MAHIHRVYDTDGHFIINADTRLLENASEARVNLVQYDHNSERVTFELERYVDGHDMSTCNRVEVIFTNKGTGGTSKGRYIVNDLQIAPDDDGVVIFSWLISQAATLYDGALSFGVRFICTSEAGVLDYAWNTATYTGLTVSKGSGDASVDETVIFDGLEAEIDKRAVRYDAPQDLTDEQRKQVWENIGLPEEEEEEVIPATVATPEQYGAVGDGVHDDAPALKAALESGLPVILTKDLWIKSETIITDHNVDLDGQGHTLHCNNGCLTFRASSWDATTFRQEASGAVVQITDAAGGKAKGLTSSITAAQLGTGNPSPDNVRPIKGWDAVQLFRAPTYDTTYTPMLVQDLPESVYGGSLDWTTGVLTVTHVGKAVRATDISYKYGSSTSGWQTSTFVTKADASLAAGRLTSLCSHFKNTMDTAYTAGSARHGIFSDHPTMTTKYFAWGEPDATVTDFQNWLEEQYAAGTPVQVVYRLATPYTIQITPQQLDLLKGYNAVWSDSGSTALTYGAEATDRVGACSKVSSTTQSEYEADRSPYFRGYLTYEGRKTLQEEYEDYQLTYFDIYSARLRNFAMVCENMDYGNGKGMCALSLYYLCNSSVENVRTVLKDGEEGSAGICAIYCQNLRIDRCHSAGWTAAKNGAIADVRGYGFQLSGDNICISHCSGEQCKHIITVGSTKDCWNTNIIIDHCNFRTDFTKTQRADGSCYYMQQLDVHGDARNVTITGCNFYWWALDGNSMSAAVIALRNPTTVISNCSVHSNGAWINFGEFAESIHIDQLYAPEVHLTTNYRIGGDHNKTHFLPELHVSNSEFARLRDSSSPTRVYLTGCVIREMLIDVQYLVARGCVFPRERTWASQPTMVLTGESILSDCIIYGHRENAISKRTPIIRAPEKSVRMSHCKIYKRQGAYPTFDTEQDEGVGNWYEDVFAFYLNTQNELDKNTLQ